MFDLSLIQSVIGYDFVHSDLLKCAFTHSSYTHEHPECEGNERLEFLGDALLNFLAAEQLFKSLPQASEGTLSSKRVSMVSRTPLSGIIDKLGLLEQLRVGNGVSKRDFSDKARSDLFEAILGAMYLDGGIDVCRAFLDRVFFDNVAVVRDYKSEFQHYCAKRGITPVYDTSNCGGYFVAELNAEGRKFSGKARTKHAAEIAAARAVIEFLEAKDG